MSDRYEDAYGGQEDEYGRPIRNNSKFKKHSVTVIKKVKSRKHALFKALIHIPSIVITCGVLSLTFRNLFWKVPSDDINVILNSLQFAAQFHGSFIVASLSAMLLHLVHHKLIGNRGVPLGFVGSVFQLSQISFLWQKEFYSLRWKYILLFLPTSILVILTGPASAITMLPRLQFWDVPDLWLNKGSLEFRVYMKGTEQDLFPGTLTASNISPNCFLANASIQTGCPSSGIRHWIMNSDDLFTIVDAEPSINRTIEGGWLRNLVGQHSMVNQGLQSVYVTSTLSNFYGDTLIAYENLVEGFGAYKSTILGVANGKGTVQSATQPEFAGRYDLTLRSGGKNFPSRKPLVEVECAGHTKDATSLPLLHDRMIYPPWNEDPIFSTQWSVLSSDYSSLVGDLNSTIVNATWIPNEQFGNVKPSLGAIFSTPEVLAAGGTYTVEEGMRSANFSYYTCTIDARWMPTKAFSEVSNGIRTVIDALPNPIGSELRAALGPESKHMSALPLLFLAESWVKALDVPWIDSIATKVPTNRTVLQVIGQRCLDSNTLINATLFGKEFDDKKPHRITKSPMAMLICLEVWLSIFLTEGIAHAQDSIPAYFVAEGHNLPVSSDDFYYKDAFLVQKLGNDISHQASKPDPRFADTRVHDITKANFENPDNYTEIHISTSRWGYGWGFQDSKLIYVGVTLLLLHVALCVAYIVWILSMGDYRSAGWESIGELVSMAMRSGKGGEDEAEKSGGEEAKKRWMKRIVVREVATEGSERGTTLVLRKGHEFEAKGGVEDLAL